MTYKNIEEYLSMVVFSQSFNFSSAIKAVGSLTDDKYEYTETGYPFFKEIGEIIYEYDKSRKREYRADVTGFKIVYDKK